MLMAALSAMHDKNSNLEETLKLEKMLNRDLYSHMEELKQQISKQRGRWLSGGICRQLSLIVFSSQSCR